MSMIVEKMRKGMRGGENEENGGSEENRSVLTFQHTINGSELLTQSRGVRPSKVDYSNGCKSRSGKVGQPPDSKHRAGGGNSKC